MSVFIKKTPSVTIEFRDGTPTIVHPFTYPIPRIGEYVHVKGRTHIVESIFYMYKDGELLRIEIHTKVN